jgi:hypothetical protein
MVPPADAAGLGKLDIILGCVTGARPGPQIVLYVKSEKWWSSRSQTRHAPGFNQIRTGLIHSVLDQSMRPSMVEENIRSGDVFFALIRRSVIKQNQNDALQTRRW